jgi:hypothetical protein
MINDRKIRIEHETTLTEYISFLNSLNLEINTTDIINVQDPPKNSLSGWIGIKSFTCTNDKKDVYDIDVRFAWSDQIFKQHLYDHGWNNSILLDRGNKHKSRDKLIIYLCSPSTGLKKVKDKFVPTEFIIGSYWKSIRHLYLFPLPNHPFDLPNRLDYNNIVDPYMEISSPTTLVKNNHLIVEGELRKKGINRIGTSIKPLISVITIVFNGEEKLEQTIQSVINQKCDNFEYIIIDGGSTDRTLEIINKYDDKINYWISEEDKGIYDAMNKGIAAANGKWLNFMNCGDLFYNSTSLANLPLSEDIDFYYSDTILYSKYNSARLHICSQSEKILIHQSIVYKKSAHDNSNYLVCDKLLVSDYLFFRQNDCKKWVKIDVPISIYNTEGISSNSPTHFVQYLFVNFIFGDISELKMSFFIIERSIKQFIILILKYLKIR